jgi:IS5 family transposase
VKTSVAVTAKESVMVGMRSIPGSPYHGHTLHSQLEQVEILTGVKPAMALANRGYRGVAPPEGTQLLISHNWLKGSDKDAVHAVL